LNLSHILLALPENPSQDQVDAAEEQAKKIDR
jgi:peptidyl-prolyl cis-trans isomerase SurA